MKKLLIALSLLLNVIALSMSLLVFIQPVFVADLMLDGIRRDRNDLFDTFELNSQDIVFLGDSISHHAPWHEMFPDYRVRNRGVSGDTTGNVLARLDAIVIGQPRAIFLKIGTNDLTHGPASREQSYRQYREIVARITTESPGTRVYLQSLLPRAEKFRPQLLAFNQQLATIATDHGVEYIDLYDSFVAQDGSIRDDLSADELHLNGRGYQKWRERLLPYLRDL